MNKKMVHAILCAVINAADRMVDKGRNIVTEGADSEELVRRGYGTVALR